MHQRKSLLRCGYPLLLCGLLAHCGSKKNNSDGPASKNGLQSGGTQSGRLAPNVALNLQGAFGAIVVDNSSSAGLAIVTQHNKMVDQLKLPVKKFTPPTTLQLAQGSDNVLTLEGDDFYFPIAQGAALLDDSSATTTDTSTTSGSTFLKIKTDGTTAEAVEAESASAYQARISKLQANNPDKQYDSSPSQPLPKILTVVQAPDKQVYVNFAYPFQFRDAEQGVNVYDQTTGYQCQFFRLTGGTIDDLTQKAPSLNNLECIDNKRFAQQWQQGSSTLFQFDSAGNVFYPGSLPSVNKLVVERIGPTDTWEQTPTELINANICLQNFLVTPSSGVFYTGSTCNSTAGSNNSGYFRYISPGNTDIIEIARGWWNFKYNTRVKTAEDTSTSDMAVFFGPDPTDATSASWNTACLFSFDPTGDTPETRISKVITCGNNIWDWMQLSRAEDTTSVEDGGLGFGYGFNNYRGSNANFTPSAAWKTEYKRRCETGDEVFAGGGSQISEIQQSSTGDIYVIGNIRKKLPGSLSCDLEIRGPYCLLDGVPILSGTRTTDQVDITGISTSTTCSSVGGTWYDNGSCSWGNASTIKACLGIGNTYISSVCADADGNPLTQFTNSADCLNTSGNTRVWNWGNDSYRNVTNEYCLATETGARQSFRTWDDATNHFSAATRVGATVYSADTYANKFIINNFNCTASTTSGSSGGDGWTQEFQALAKVDSTKKTLSLLSKSSEQAISLWVVQDVPYYSSYDTSLGKYLLNKIVAAPALCVDTSITDVGSCTGTGNLWDTNYRACTKTAYTDQTSCETATFSWATNASKIGISNFETYALSQSTDSASLLINGLDFSSNTYKFGNANLETGNISLDTGVTGIVQTVVIFNPTK